MQTSQLEQIMDVTDDYCRNKAGTTAEGKIGESEWPR